MAVYSVNNSNGRFTLRLTLTESNISTANNESDVNYSLDLIANTSWDFKTYRIGRKVVLDGSTVYEVALANSSQFDLASYGSINLASGKKTIKHNDNGSKSISVAYSINMATADWTPGPLSGSGTMTLSTIARASQPSLITWPQTTASFTMGETIYVHMNKKANFTHKVQCKVGNATLDIATGVVNNCPWNTSGLFPYCKSSKELSGTVVVTTYNGTMQIGDQQSVAFKAIVAENSTTKPVAKIISLSPVGDLPEWVTSPYVQGLSKVTASMQGTAKASAGIASYSITVGGKTTKLQTTSESVGITSSNAIEGSGNVMVVGFVTDSRGIHSDQVSSNITVIPYAEPYLLPHSQYTKIYCSRCDENGELSDIGTYLKLIIQCDWYSLADRENTATVTVKCYNSHFDSGWISIPITEQGGGSDNNYVSFCDINTMVDGVVLDPDSSYFVVVRCTDRFGKYDDIEYPIPTSKVCFHLGEGGNKAAFGKYAEIDNALEIAEDWDVYGRVYSLGKLKELPEGADLNSAAYRVFGVYCVGSNERAATISNIPIPHAGRLIVSSANGTGSISGPYAYILHEYITLNGDQYYRLIYTAGTEDEWLFKDWAQR